MDLDKLYSSSHGTELGGPNLHANTSQHRLSLRLISPLPSLFVLELINFANRYLDQERVASSRFDRAKSVC